MRCRAQSDGRGQTRADYVQQIFSNVDDVARTVPRSGRGDGCAGSWSSRRGPGVQKLLVRTRSQPSSQRVLAANPAHPILVLILDRASIRSPLSRLMGSLPGTERAPALRRVAPFGRVSCHSMTLVGELPDTAKRADWLGSTLPDGALPL